MKILHVVPGLDEIGNGIAVAAKLIAGEQNAALVDAHDFSQGHCDVLSYDEVWVHSCWLPMTLKFCWRVLKGGGVLVRMTHANFDPVRLKYHGWKKWLVGPIERFFLRRCAKIVATCEAEKGWIEKYLGSCCPPIEVTDIKRFFDFSHKEQEEQERDKIEPLHLLYLGRRHPLKGLEYLESAVRQIQEFTCSTCATLLNKVELKIVNNAFGGEKEKVWDWCDVLVLPTLSENFGLVIAEALERGKRVITTDGAPAWGGDCECKMENVKCKIGEGEIWSGYDGRIIYLKGYRDGTPEGRVQLLRGAIEVFRGTTVRLGSVPQ